MSSAQAKAKRTDKLSFSQLVRDYSQLLSGLVIGCCSLGGALGGAMIISGGVERGVERGLEGKEDIAVEVQGFNSTNSTDRQMIAHNYGKKTGILMPEVIVIVRDEHGKELERLSTVLIPGYKAKDNPEPFTLSGTRGTTYYLGSRAALPKGAKHCVLEYRVKRSAHESRTGESPQFECNE